MILVLAALASLAGDPEGVVTTARDDTAALARAMSAPEPVVTATPTSQDAAPHDLTTDEQINRWLASRASSDAAPYAEDDLVGAPEERKMHGVVSAGIGTGGYRSFGAAVTMPIGDQADLTVAYSEGRNLPYGYGYGGFDGYGYGRHGGFGYDHQRVGRSRSVAVGLDWSNSRDRRDEPWREQRLESMLND
ncbi:hypothetical protein [Brevundimonas sp. PAMC22021]|uniref:hypothetical protein n=1 Tax=Brevundimonas sp. PAMC22021 TaxID=2861285 RepID=UPI001C63B1ED|nr:hypothetical protein [Brevundimonas sp. PAMC22021]QYF87754.1 hypothetical protein KY493_04455 [Brevundimonas sp. PAMC22021]